MKPWRWLLATAVILPLCADSARTGIGDDTGGLDEFSAHMDRRVPELMHRYRVPGVAVAVVENGTVAWAHGYGDAGADRPMTAQSLFRAESISKMFTAWAILQLVEQGRLQLDAPVSEHLGGDWLAAVTARRLLSHTAGIDYPDDPRMAHPPGERFLYSNGGYVLLERLLEAVTEHDFGGYLEEEILRPLGLHGSTYQWNETVEAALVTGHSRDGAAVAVARDTPRGPAGLYASAVDLARFLVAGMGDAAGGGVLDAESVALMQAPATATEGFVWTAVAEHYGLGHALETLPDGRRAVGHGGEGRGGINWSLMVPESGVGIVILTNSKRSSRLLAELAGDWAAFHGLGSVRMSRTFERYAFAMQTATLVFGLATFWLIGRLIAALVAGRRRFGLATHDPRRRLAQLLLAGALAIGWLMGPAPMAGHLFPVLSLWLEAMLLLFALMLVVIALCPRREP